MEILTAKEYALKVHADDRYGDEPYGVHLQAVVDVLKDFGYQDQWLEAGWLHDTPEVRGMSPLEREQEIELRFGPWVRNIVHACYGVGHTRNYRNAVIYTRILEYPEAAPVKVADRISHLEATKAGTKFATMYLREHTMFAFHVGQHAPNMLDRLNKAYRRLRAEHSC